MATRWGVVSAGKISHDFVTAVRSLPGDEHKFVAVAARNVDRAKEFAVRHGIPKAYGSYEEMAKDPDVEVVYIGTITSQHFPVGKLMLEHGKHVLMEKPMALDLGQTKALVKMAKTHGCFLMEAIWSRFLPSYKHLMDLLRANTVGQVVHVKANLGIPFIVGRETRDSLKRGEAILDVAVYPLNAVCMVFGGEKPVKIAAVGCSEDDGVPISMAASLLYSKNRTAEVTTNATANLPCDLVITGTKGHIKVPNSMWCATTVETPSGTRNFPLPDPVSPCNFPGSSGLKYEAAEVRKCLKAGALESSVMPLKDSETLSEIMEEICRQIGATHDEDDD